MVTHSSTSRPVQCLCMAERTGCPVFTDLWSYVLEDARLQYIKLKPAWRAVVILLPARPAVRSLARVTLYQKT